jgi:hypothetical protein
MRLTKIFFILISITCIECERNNEAPDESPAIPDWLKIKIAEMEDNKYYAGASVVRHEWKSTYYYHINIPLSSCLYCDVYNQNGDRVDWEVESREDYINNRKNQTVIWTWKDREQP